MTKALLFALALLAWSSSALAHAVPARAQPAVGATIDQSPEAVRLWFDADLEPAFSTVRVLNAQGHSVAQEKSQVSARERGLIELPLPPLGTGKYKVVWRAVAVDGHVTQGEYAFTVGH